MEVVGFKHPYTMIVNGATGSGKTTWIMKLIENIQLIQPSPEKIYFFFESWQSAYQNASRDIEFHRKELTEEIFIKLSKRHDKGGGCLFVLDDGMTLSLIHI